MSQSSTISVTLRPANLATIDAICQVAGLPERQDAINLIFDLYGRAVLDQLQGKVARIPAPVSKPSQPLGFTTAPLKPFVPELPEIINQSPAPKPPKPLG